MQLPYQTQQDDSLVHQVRFIKKHKDAEISISCNCLKSIPSTGVAAYESMGFSHDLETARELYNDSSNHRAPFGEEDEAKW